MGWRLLPAEVNLNPSTNSAVVNASPLPAAAPTLARDVLVIRVGVIYTMPTCQETALDVARLRYFVEVEVLQARVRFDLGR